MRELVPRLNARGMSTEVVSVYAPRLGAQQLRELGAPVHHRLKTSGFDVRHFVWLQALIAARKPAIVHTHQWAGKYVGRAAAILAATPIIVHTEHSPLPVSAKERLMAFVLAQKTDAVISFNEHKAALIAARERVRKFEIIRNGIPVYAVPSLDERIEARRRLDVPDGTIVFGVVASLQERKNPLLALRSFARMKTAGAPVTRLDFFGEGVLQVLLEAQATSLGVAERVRFHGFRPDVRELLPGLDVFVTLATQEMAPISMLEAMAARLPIIGAPHPGTIEMLEQNVNGAIVDWDLESVASAMRLARDDPEWRRRCGVAGRDRVERQYNIEDIADQHILYYDSLMAERRWSRGNR